ncbi:FAD-dependent monooxygenase [Apiospora aurea]|uniref:FAD-dependent monooxygenase n=1 Tax=Apiospora aurea TaxID=335848 RepID=A0ABR1QKN7_9PEZI
MIMPEAKPERMPEDMPPNAAMSEGKLDAMVEPGGRSSHHASSDWATLKRSVSCWTGTDDDPSNARSDKLGRVTQAHASTQKNAHMPMTMSEADASPTVLVVGGGLAGLFCALECVRNGFGTTLVESKPAIQTAGDFITIGPTAIHVLRRWPSMAAALDRIAYKPEIYYHKQDGELLAGPHDRGRRRHPLAQLWHRPVRAGHRVVGLAARRRPGDLVRVLGRDAGPGRRAPAARRRGVLGRRPPRRRRGDPARAHCRLAHHAAGAAARLGLAGRPAHADWRRGAPVPADDGQRRDAGARGRRVAGAVPASGRREARRW